MTRQDTLKFKKEETQKEDMRTMQWVKVTFRSWKFGRSLWFDKPKRVF